MCRERPHWVYTEVFLNAIQDSMKPDDNHLVWLDLEMTGLEPAQDRIIEIATLVTDTHLEILAEGPVIAVHQPEAVLAALDDWNREHHGPTRDLSKERPSDRDEAGAERETSRPCAASPHRRCRPSRPTT